MLGQGIGPNGVSHLTTFYDPTALMIVQLNLGTDGSVTKALIHPDDNNWMRTSTYIRRNGQKSTLDFSENNNTMSIQISGETDGAIVAKQTNVWRRVQ